MQRVGSYVAAAVVIIAIVMGIFWAVGKQPVGAAGLQRAGPYKFKAMPAGADGPLRQCVVCHSVETGGPLRVGPPLHGIVGARKARLDWYGYSPAISSKIDDHQRRSTRIGAKGANGRIIGIGP